MTAVKTRQYKAEKALPEQLKEREFLRQSRYLRQETRKHFGTVMICQYRHLKPAYRLKITINLYVSNVTLNVITVWGTGLLDANDVSGIRFLTRLL